MVTNLERINGSVELELDIQFSMDVYQYYFFKSQMQSFGISEFIVVIVVVFVIV